MRPEPPAAARLSYSLAKAREPAPPPSSAPKRYRCIDPKREHRLRQALSMQGSASGGFAPPFMPDGPRPDLPSTAFIGLGGPASQHEAEPRWEGEVLPINRLVHLGLKRASADGVGGEKHPGVRAFKMFCRDHLRTPWRRPMDPRVTPLWALLEEEWIAMQFVCALVEHRGVEPLTASGYLSAVQGWHANKDGVKLAGGIKFERLPRMLKGLRRIFGDTPRKIRRGIAPQALRRAMDKLLDPKIPAHANIRAALSSAFAALLRCSEFALDNGKRWDPQRGLTRADIKELTTERAVLMTAPSKNNHHLGGKTCPVVMGAGGQFIDPVAEIANMLAVDPLPAGMDPATVPLFRDTSMGWHEPLRARSVLAVTRDLMHSVGENPEQFGTHSYRIGGASALFAAGADETVIRTMGRWSSDIYHLYVRACFERCCEWTRKAGSTVVTDVARTVDEVHYY